MRSRRALLAACVTASTLAWGAAAPAVSEQAVGSEIVWLPLGVSSAVVVTNANPDDREVRLVTLPGNERLSLRVAAESEVQLGSSDLPAGARALGFEGPTGTQAALRVDDPNGPQQMRSGARAVSGFGLTIEAGEAGSLPHLLLLNPSARPARVSVVLSSATGTREPMTLALPAAQVAAVPLPDEAGLRVALEADQAVVGFGARLSTAGTLTSLSVPSTWTGNAWSFPLGHDMPWVGQVYAQRGVRDAGRYHTGIDIGGSWGSDVRAVAAGTVVKIQLNGGGQDHGFGNTVALRHDESLFGHTLYTQYSHLDGVRPELVAACGGPDPGKSYRHTCTRSLRVGRGEPLGQIGASGYGQRYYWGDQPHLHFELRSFATLGPRGDDASGYDYGYVSVHPDVPTTPGARYFNPFLRLHSVSALHSALPLRLVRSAEVLAGPGGRASGPYRTASWASAGEALDGWVQAPATSSPWCSGWYLARRRSGAHFSDQQYGGTLPEGWICQDHVAEASASPTPTPTPLPTPTPAPTPQPAVQLRIDGGTSSSRPQGATFSFTGHNLTRNGGTTRWLRQPNGSTIELQPRLRADGSGRVSWSYSPVCTTPTGTYSLWIVDEATARRSNTVQEIVTHGSGCP